MRCSPRNARPRRTVTASRSTARPATSTRSGSSRASTSSRGSPVASATTRTSRSRAHAACACGASVSSTSTRRAHCPSHTPRCVEPVSARVGVRHKLRRERVCWVRVGIQALARGA
eukprot:1712953-Prymnesium_polylepis.1